MIERTGTTSPHPGGRWFALAGGCLVVGGAALIAACEPEGVTDPVLDADSAVVVSNPTDGFAVARQQAGVLQQTAGTSTSSAPIFVSLAPGTVPDGERATVRNPRTGGAVSVSMRDGGFDPVAIGGEIGDIILINVRVGSAERTISHPVPSRRAPVVVRVDPPRKKRDVPLNASVFVVFSEPVDATTLEAAVQLSARGTHVPGTIRLLGGSGSVAVLTPDHQLESNTDYRLDVTDGVRDLDGDRLDGSHVIEFTTGESLAGEPASIQLSPDSIEGLFPGTTYDIIATVRDAADNVLTGYSVTWTSSDERVATVAAIDSVWLTAGRVKGVAEGRAVVTATAGDITATAAVVVSEAPPAGVASLTITPGSLALGQFDLGGLHVTLRDAGGRALGERDSDVHHETYLRVSWSVDRPDIVDITKDSMSLAPRLWTAHWNDQGVVALAEGTAMLVATSEGVSDTAFVTVTPPRPVASLHVGPVHWTVQPGDTHVLYAEAFDAQGKPITWRHGRTPEIAWTVDNPALASVDEVDCDVSTSWPMNRGPGRLACRAQVSILDTGFVSVSAMSEGVSAKATIAAPPPVFTSVSAGGHANPWYIDDYVGHTCATTAAGLTVCWGGDGGAIGDEWTHFSTAPWGLASGQRFEVVSAGTLRSCGLSAAGEAYCWGSDIYLDPWYDYVEPLDGIRNYGLTSEPHAVAGGHTFVALDGGVSAWCGLTASGETYCWGDWNGSPLNDSPTLVEGGAAFVAVTVGRDHACGLTSAGAAHCWGSNGSGQLGDGSTAAAASPVPVSGGHTFTAITAGDAHTCGLDRDGRVYCWGHNVQGELGDGGQGDRAVPAPVAGDLTFAALSAGAAASTTCALTAAGAAYCWGANEYGQLGSGVMEPGVLGLHAVAGGLSFRSVSTGDRHTCGVTIDGSAYCWGWNGAGQLGNGSQVSSSVPVRVNWSAKEP